MSYHGPMPISPSEYGNTVLCVVGRNPNDPGRAGVLCRYLGSHPSMDAFLVDCYGEGPSNGGRVAHHISTVVEPITFDLRIGGGW